MKAEKKLRLHKVASVNSSVPLLGVTAVSSPKNDSRYLVWSAKFVQVVGLQWINLNAIEISSCLKKTKKQVVKDIWIIGSDLAPPNAGEKRSMDNENRVEKKCSW